jgi:hypothetical protein
MFPAELLLQVVAEELIMLPEQGLAVVTLTHNNAQNIVFPSQIAFNISVNYIQV